MMTQTIQAVNQAHKIHLDNEITELKKIKRRGVK